MAFGRECKLRHRRIANAHIKFNGGLGPGAQDEPHSGGNRPAAAHQEHVALVLAFHVLQRVGYALNPLRIAGHAHGAGCAVGPLHQSGTQYSKMISDCLRCGRFGQRFGVNRGNDGSAVVLVQAIPGQWLMGQICALGNAAPGLCVAL